MLELGHSVGIRMTRGEIVPPTWKQDFIRDNKAATSAVMNALRRSAGSLMLASRQRLTAVQDVGKTSLC